LNSLASSQVVNGTLGATKWVITPFGAMDPPVLAANIVAEVGENLGGPIAGDILAIVSTLMTGLGAAGLLLGIASAAATTVGLPFVLGALAFAGAVVVLELTAAAVISEVGTMIDHMNPPSAPRRRRRRRENVRPKALGLRHCCLAV
jgi:hypothetical protein